MDLPVGLPELSIIECVLADSLFLQSALLYLLFQQLLTFVPDKIEKEERERNEQKEKRGGVEYQRNTEYVLLG